MGLQRSLYTDSQGGCTQHLCVLSHTVVMARLLALPEAMVTLNCFLLNHIHLIHVVIIFPLKLVS